MSFLQRLFTPNCRLMYKNVGQRKICQRLYRSYHKLSDSEDKTYDRHARLNGTSGSRALPPFAKYADSWIHSLSEPEHTDGVVEVVPYNYEPTPEILAKLGFNQVCPDATFSVLCDNISSSNPDIIAIRREIPQSDVIYHVKQISKLGILFDGHEDVLNSDLFRKTAHFIGIIGNHLELDLDTGEYKPNKCINKSALFNTIDTLIADNYPEQIRREYNVFRGAIQEGWPKGTGRNALFTLLTKALNVCDKYARSINLRNDSNTYVEPLEIRNLGGNPADGTKSFPSKFTCNYSMLGEDRSQLPLDMYEKRKYINKSWKNYDPVCSKAYLPDLQLIRRRSPDNSLDRTVCMTAEIKGTSPIINPHMQQSAWRQALIGLQYSRKTYALIMSLCEAKLFKIEVLEDNSLLTSEKSYYFDVEGSNMFHNEALVDLFRDIVRIMWERKLEEIEY